MPVTILKRFQHRCFLVNFANFLRTPVLKSTSGQLIRILLTITTRQKWNLLAVPSENDLESDFLINIFVEMSKHILKVIEKFCL